MPGLRRFLLLAVMLPASVLSCADPTGPDDVTVYSVPGFVAIRNDGDSPLFSIAFDEAVLPLVDYWRASYRGADVFEPGPISSRRVRLRPGF